jgi:hypothetical protein
MPTLSHIMPNPVVVPILWGHDYVANPNTTTLIEQMVSDLVTGPFMNGLAQYGVRRGRLMKPIIIDDTNPRATVTYYDTNNNLKDDITKKLISWINAGLVPPLPSAPGINQLYLIIPPSETTPETFNGSGDPIGNGIQGWHNEGVTNPSSTPPYYWAIVKTNDSGNPNTGITFVNNFAQKVAHELAERFLTAMALSRRLAIPASTIATPTAAGRSRNTGRFGTTVASAAICLRQCRAASKPWTRTNTFLCSGPMGTFGESKHPSETKCRQHASRSMATPSPSKRST